MPDSPVEDLEFVAAVSRNGVIGRDGELPWKLPDDLKYFKKSTLGHALIMGRGTYQSLPVKLPGRKLIVISRTMTECPPDVTAVVRSLGEALQAAADAGDRSPLIGGGASIFAEALPLATRLRLTAVETDVEGDTHFPEVDWSQWRLVEETQHDADERHAHAFRFTVWERCKPAGTDAR